jgi:hypothetical protein
MLVEFGQSESLLGYFWHSTVMYDQKVVWHQCLYVPNGHCLQVMLLRILLLSRMVALT